MWRQNISRYWWEFFQFVLRLLITIFFFEPTLSPRLRILSSLLIRNGLLTLSLRSIFIPTICFFFLSFYSSSLSSSTTTVFSLFLHSTRTTSNPIPFPKLPAYQFTPALFYDKSFSAFRVAQKPHSNISKTLFRVPPDWYLSTVSPQPFQTATPTSQQPYEKNNLVCSSTLDWL